MTPREKLIFISKSRNTTDYPKMIKSSFGLNTQQTKSMRFQAILASLLHKELNCYICGSPIIHFSTKDEGHFENGESITYDHVFPSCFNGTNHVLNGRGACSKCNREKSDSLEFETYRGMVRVIPEKRFYLRDLIYSVKQQMLEKGVQPQEYIGCFLHFFMDTANSLMSEEQVYEFEEFCHFVDVPITFGDTSQFKHVFVGILTPI